MLALNSSGATYKGREKKKTTLVPWQCYLLLFQWSTLGTPIFIIKILILIPNSISQILTFPVKDEGNSASNLLLSPNLQKQNENHTKIINNPNRCHKLHNTLSSYHDSTNFRKKYLLLKVTPKIILTEKSTPLYTA